MTTVAPPQLERAGAPPGPRPAGRRFGAVAPAFYWMVVPAVVLFFLLNTVPVLQGIFYSFTDYRGYGPWEFVGLRNYANLFLDTRTLGAYQFTFLLAIGATVLVNVIALALAMGLNANVRFRNGLRAIFFLPNILAILIIGYIFQFLFSSSLPALGAALGIEWLSTNILGDASTAWIGVLFVTVWHATAFAVILYIAGLQTVPVDVYEASAVDGANAWQRFRSITFPLIAPFFTINMVLTAKNMLMVFDQVIALTEGGPGTATETISMVIYRGGFQGGEFAFQTANAVVYFVVILAVSFFQLRVLRAREEAL
jgi:raffinose/stachyose/melibiose transport system permease protein